MPTLRIIDKDRKAEFLARGYNERHFFPHETIYIPRCAMDGFSLANRMCGINNPNSLWQIILYARGDSIAEFPQELFFDNDIIWHQEHFGKPGQIAAANLVVDGDKLYTLEHISDLVQRIHLRKEYRTRINRYFKHWHHMLLNSVLNFAVENSLKYIYSPTADLLVKEYYPKVDRRLFDRIYDRDVTMHYNARRRNGMWVVDVNENHHKLIVPIKNERPAKSIEKTVCLFHDLERGAGHVKADAALAEYADNNAVTVIDKMLKTEKEKNVKVTYNVVGTFLDEVRESIEKDSHCIAFHSYNHQLSHQPVTNYMGEGPILSSISNMGYRLTHYANKVRRRFSLPPIDSKPISEIYIDLVNLVRKVLSLRPIINQLHKCQSIDYRINGYRPCEPNTTSEGSDSDLCYYSFEWTAIDDNAPGAEPILQNRIVKIPVFCDDYSMYKHNTPYEIWESGIIERIKRSKFTAVGLHDCYANYWLPHYDKLLEKISSLGQLKTLNEVANEVILANSI